MSKPISSTPRRNSQSETDSEKSSLVSSPSASEKSSASEDGSKKSAKTPVMKTHQTSDAASTTPATHNTNSGAPLQTTMTSSTPTVKNRQTGDQKRARYVQTHTLDIYKRKTKITKINTTKQSGAADIQQAPKQDNRRAPSAQAIDPNHHSIVRAPQGSDTSEPVMASHNMGDAYALDMANFLQGETELALDFNDAIGAEGAVALAKALKGNTTLKTLDLGGNAIDAEGAVALAEALKGNTILTTLHLNENAIGEEGAVALANALKFNTNLRTLYLISCSLDTGDAALLADALRANTTLTSLNLSLNSQVDWEIREEIEELLEKNRQRKENLPYAKASLDLLVRHSPVLKNMGFPTDVIPVLAQQLSNEVLAVFGQEWQEVFRAPAPPVITTTTNATITTTTTTTTDSTIPTTLISSPAATATSPASAPPVSTQPTATAADINALLADANPVAALSRWIDGHANPTAALNWVDPSNGYTLLHYAVAAQEGGVVRSLLARPIDRTRADQNNQTAAQLAQQRAESSSSSAVAAIAALFK